MSGSVSTSRVTSMRLESSGSSATATSSRLIATICGDAAPGALPSTACSAWKAMLGSTENDMGPRISKLRPVRSRTAASMRLL